MCPIIIMGQMQVNAFFSVHLKVFSIQQQYIFPCTGRIENKMGTSL